MSCRGDPFLEVRPRITATIRSRMPKVFHATIKRSRTRVSLAANQAMGIANAPVTKSPQPALYGKGPESLPAKARNTNRTPPTRMTLRPTSNGKGTALNTRRAAGIAKTKAAVVASGVPNIANTVRGFERAPAPATAPAKPIHAPAAPATTSRPESRSGIDVTMAVRITAKATPTKMAATSAGEAILRMRGDGHAALGSEHVEHADLQSPARLPLAIRSP